MTPARVLIVDDNELNLEIAAHVLRRDGFEVATAHDGRAALARLAERLPDLVLMDIQLPGLDGLTLTRQLRDDPTTRHLVIVAFTAFAMKGDRERMIAAGCDGYIAKPIDVARFADQVRAHLRR
jgi:CheY-like chemotaxis protein